jgi:hypothetical protein
MIRVFVSYRRDDSRHQAGRLYDHLVEQFGKKYVFKDVDSIPLGSDFRAVLTERVAGCDVFLAVIGDSWLSSAGPGGTRRLDDPGDFVRIEIEAALGRSIPVIPVLVGGSSVPKPEELPGTLRELAFRNGLQVRPNPDFHDDVERLIRGIKAAVSGSPKPRARRVGLIGLPALTAVLGGLLLGTNIYLTANKGGIKLEGNDTKAAAGKEQVRPDPTAGGSGSLPTGPDQTAVSEPPAPRGDAPSQKKGPASSPTVRSTGTFQPLFNGKDLTGWSTHPNQPGNWHVTNGVLIGSGPALSHLYTKRNDYTDFHLRVEARFNEGGRGGVYFRCPFGPSLPSSDDLKWPDGFKATINNRGITGGIYPGVGGDIFADNIPSVPVGQWFTMDLVVDGRALGVRVNGRPSGYKFARNRLHQSGHIALQQQNPQTVIEFRTIEIKELNRPDQKDPRELQRFPATTDPVTRVAFTRDGQGILSGACSMEVWRDPGGGRVIWYDHGYRIRLWAGESGKNEFTRDGAGWIAKALAFSSDGRHAASAENSVKEQPLLIWDLKNGKIVHKLILKDRKTQRLCTALSFSADDRRVVAASTNGAVLSWDLVTEEEQPPITLDTGPIGQEEFGDAAFTSDRQHLVTAGQTGVVELWDLQTGKRLKKFAGHAARVNLVACSADGTLILSAGGDKTVRLWDVDSVKELVQLKNDDWPVNSIAISPDGRRALSAGLNGPVHLWDLASGKEVCRMEGHAMRVNSVAFSPDGRQAVSGSDDTTVRLWQLPN